MSQEQQMIFFLLCERKRIWERVNIESYVAQFMLLRIIQWWEVLSLSQFYSPWRKNKYEEEEMQHQNSVVSKKAISCF